ncbi:F-box protein SKIP31 [Hibiscus syriacus]|uniref:F-box protein SKIP31 n=1 Tax=Hibiscus syriacus TaxID=106335 RepID=A0A6A2WRV5_HIBSY|nr:F-box protein SKIP31 [Hibiscus syriacus]
MTFSDEEDELLANFLESELSDEEETEAKRLRVVKGDEEEEKKREGDGASSSNMNPNPGQVKNTKNMSVPRVIESGTFSKIPPELFTHILKFLSSEDLVSCSLVCSFLNYAASDESLWRRLYCMRRGLLPPTKMWECPWKKLYIQRDEEDMSELVKDDSIILDETVADQVSMWKSSRGLADKVITDHACSGETCTYYQIRDVFVCEKTGQVYVCDDTCREVILDPNNELLVCTISGHCFDRLLSPSEMELDNEQQQAGGTDEAELFMGSGHFARAYLLGYN